MATLQQKNLLEPFGKIFSEMDQKIRSMTDEKLNELLSACYAMSVTNCWYCSYSAAQYLQGEIRRELRHRQSLRSLANKRTADA